MSISPEVRLPIYWWVLSMQAGAINAGGVLSCHRGVSHVTGFGTRFGTEAAQARWGAAWGLLSVPIFFLIGATLCTYIVEHSRSSVPNKYYGYSAVLALIFLALTLTSVLGANHYFGPFDAPLNLTQHYWLLVILSLSCGLQNAIFSDKAGAVIRSTHMTGPVTDLGIDLGRLFLRFTDRYNDVKFSDLRKSLRLIFYRIGALSCFILGAWGGAYLYLRVHYLGFLFPAFLCLCLLVNSFQIHKRLFFR
jgi:uncharacterized membrane protein YoaK (UPF0700 family)